MTPRFVRRTAPPPADNREILRRLAARVDPDDAGAQNNLGVVYFGRGLIDEAVDAFHRALEIDPSDPVASRNLAVVCLAPDSSDRVTRALADRLRRDPTDHTARLRLARTYRHTGRAGAAATELRRLLAAAPDDAAALRELGLAEEASGRPDQALSVYEQALGRDPESAVLHHHVGLLHYRQGRAQAGRRHLERAVELEPALTEGWYALAFVLGDLGQDGAAHRALARSGKMRPPTHQTAGALSLDRASPARFRELTGAAPPRPEVAPTSFPAHYHLGIAFRQQGRHAEAVQEFRRGREAGEVEELHTLAEAETLLLAGEDEEATGLYLRLSDGAAASAKVWNELAVCHHRAGRVEEAAAGYRRALEIDPSYPYAANNLGVLLMERGDPQGAVAALESAARGRRLVEPLANLGLIAAAAGGQQAALTHFRQATEVDPHSPVGWTGLGHALAELGRPEEARHCLARAVEVGPESAEPLYRLAFVLHQLGEHAASVHEARRAMALDPHFMEPRFRLAIELRYEYAELQASELSTEVRLAAGAVVADFSPRPGELEAAFARLQSGGADAAGLTPGGDAYGLARDYLEKGLRMRALAEIRRVAQEGADRVEAALLTGELFLRSGVQGEAVEHFGAALTGMEGRAWGAAHVRGWLGLGRSFLALERWDEARHAATVVLAKEPGDRGARRLYAEALLGDGRAAEALGVWRDLERDLPEDASCAMGVARAAEAAGEPGEAIAALERALRLDPARVDARVDLGRLLLAGGRPDRAAAQARHALEIAPGHAPAALLLAEIEAGRRKDADAVALLAGVLEKDAYHLEALERLAGLLLRSGRAGDAVSAYRRLLRFDPDSTAARRGLDAAQARLEDRPRATRRGEAAEIPDSAMGGEQTATVATGRG